MNHLFRQRGNLVTISSTLFKSSFNFRNIPSTSYLSKNILNEQFRTNLRPYSNDPKNKNAPSISVLEDAAKAANEAKMMAPNNKFIKLSWYALLTLLSSGAGIYLFFMYEKSLVEKRNKEASGVGKPKIGGSWSLVDHDGLPRTNLDFAGKYLLIYFGYTFCPDVCPEELEKMSKVIDDLRNSEGYSKETIVPIFISCDPKRDSLDSIKEYLAEFNKNFLGLTGTYEQIKRMAKAFKMYYSAPPRAVDDDEVDYLVDHSIFFYLIGPDGKYVDHFGINDTAEDVTIKIKQDINELRGIISRKNDD